ncbi:unnamed protein product [Schistosoma mattheei]|uniref:Uncharacterized protein n=1 Tax=Schistosoma mattheei TaxID=31246 RepID=A0A183NDV5_9TREM|nr:unnamed protein product [Schistosoma mattheei]
MMQRNPVIVVCYVLKRGHKNNKLPPAMTNKSSKRPFGVQIKISNNCDLGKYNAEALEASKLLLVGCSLCKRTFNLNKV